jgi:hypothetical protein
MFKTNSNALLPRLEYSPVTVFQVDLIYFNTHYATELLYNISFFDHQIQPTVMHLYLHPYMF